MRRVSSPYVCIGLSLGLTLRRTYYFRSLGCDFSSHEAAAEWIALRSRAKAQRKAQTHENNRQRAKRRWKAKRQDPSFVAHERARMRLRRELGLFNSYCRERYAKDPSYAFANRLRARMSRAFRMAKANKSSCTLDLCGCSLTELMSHLERQFTKGMCWSNHGQFWQIDHIVPCSHFDLTNPLQQRACFHWSNLRPLRAMTNLSRGNRLDRHTQVPLPV
jgi:hypothetical protein